MAKIDDNIIKKVLDAADIVDVIGEFVDLKKKGVRYVGLCPFHDDRHATNFVVYPKKQCYKCFACDAKGDVVKFLMDYKKMSFGDAIRWLGKRYHIDVDDRTVELDVKKREAPPPLPTLYLPTNIMKGTLGSITQRKVSEIFTVRKHKQVSEKPSERRPDRPEIYFTVEQLKARGRDVESWDFEVTTENGWGTPRELTDMPQVPTFKTKHTTEELKRWIADGQGRLDWPAKFSDFYKQVLEPNGVSDAEEQKELLQMAINRGFIRKQEKSEMKKGQASPRLIINPNEIPPFSASSDQDAPF